jgi:hypothetical protein
MTLPRMEASSSSTGKKHIPGQRQPIIDIGESKTVSVKAVQKTPEKQEKQVACPSAPKKPTYAQLVADKIHPVNLDVELQKCAELDELDVDATEEAAQMAEIESELDAEDENLISIDYRYVQSVEQENFWLRGEIAQLRMALINLDQMYKAEKAKVRAFSNVE